MESAAIPEPAAVGGTAVGGTAVARGEPPSRIARNLAALAGGQLVTWAMTLAWTLVVPRVLGPASIGRIVAAWSVTGILAIVLGFGTKNYLVRAIVVQRADGPALVAAGSALRVLMSPVFLALVVIYAHFAHYGHDGTLVLYLTAGATILTLLAEPMQAAFQAIERMEYLALSDVINKSAQGLVGIALALAGLGAVGFAGCWMVMSAVVLVLDAVWLRRLMPILLATSWSALRAMVRESVAYWAFGLFFMVYLWIDSAMLSLMTNPTVVGWYGLPTKLFQTLMVLPVLLSTAWLPRLVRAFQSSQRELEQAARTPVELVLIAGLPVAALVATAAAPVIRVVYGPAYEHAVPVLVILGLCVPPMYLNIMLSQILIAAQRQVAWTWVMAGATVVNPLVNAVLIPATQHRYGNGAIGAAVSLFVTELVIVVVGIALAGRGVFARSGLRRIAAAAFASAATWGVGYVLQGAGPIASLVAAALTFVILAVALRVLTPAEIDLLRRAVVQRINRRRSGAAGEPVRNAP